MRDSAHPSKSIYSCTSYLILESWHAPQLLENHVVGSCGAENVESRPSIEGASSRLKAIPHHELDRSTAGTGSKVPGGCRIYAFKEIKDVDAVLLDGRKLQVGDRLVEAIHEPIRDHDAVSFYCTQKGVTFIGDSPLSFLKDEDRHSKVYADLLARLSRLSIETLYTGHGRQPAGDVSEIIQRALLRGQAGLSGASSHRLRPVIAIGKHGILHTFGRKVQKGEIRYV